MTLLDIVFLNNLLNLFKLLTWKLKIVIILQTIVCITILTYLLYLTEINLEKSKSKAY